MQSQIDKYMRQLGHRLRVGRTEREDALAEVRAHLDEHAAALRATGLSEEQAGQQAVQAFGNVRRISRQLNAAHPRAWGPWRWVTGVLLGAAVTWGLWLAGTLPVMSVYSTRYHVTSSGPLVHQSLQQRVFHAIALASPVSMGGFSAYNYLGWFWLLPLLALYLVLPLLWGRRARHWWAPGLAYGLGHMGWAPGSRCPGL